MDVAQDAGSDHAIVACYFTVQSRPAYQRDMQTVTAETGRRAAIQRVATHKRRWHRPLQDSNLWNVFSKQLETKLRPLVQEQMSRMSCDRLENILHAAAEKALGSTLAMPVHRHSRPLPADLVLLLRQVKTARRKVQKAAMAYRLAPNDSLRAEAERLQVVHKRLRNVKNRAIRQYTRSLCIRKVQQACTLFKRDPKRGWSILHELMQDEPTSVKGHSKVREVIHPHTQRVCTDHADIVDAWHISLRAQSQMHVNTAWNDSPAGKQAKALQLEWLAQDDALDYRAFAEDIMAQEATPLALMPLEVQRYDVLSKPVYPDEVNYAVARLSAGNCAVTA